MACMIVKRIVADCTHINRLLHDCCSRLCKVRVNMAGQVYCFKFNNCSLQGLQECGTDRRQKAIQVKMSRNISVLKRSYSLDSQYPP